ncbi:MAG: hypothetical protein JST14_08535 [Bacteroidetes bacterium]|nr:hypothetical protein [Bacteroidota bacterium]
MKLSKLLPAALILLTGCFYDVESVLYPDTGCAPVTTVSYSKDIVPILSQYCLSCHSGTFASGGIPLDTYTSVKRYADNGQLLGSVQWTSGYSPMPKNGNKLSSCKVGLIQKWIEAGAPNN